MRQFLVLAVAALVPAACAPKTQAPAGRAPAAQRGDIAGVMQAKLEHAQAIVEGIATADFRLIDACATQLHLISREAEFLVHDTVTYRVFSDQFRDVTEAMAADALQSDIEAVTADYAEMINLCAGCHTYLRQERLIKGFPERVSRLEPVESPDGIGGRRDAGRRPA